MKILIITSSANLQQGLIALLESLPEVKSVVVSNQVEGTLAWVRVHNPEILLLDMDIAKDIIRNLLKDVHGVSPKTQRVLLVNNQKDSESLSNEIESVLLKGTAPGDVIATIRELLISKGKENG